jgi:hypothetical protein
MEEELAKVDMSHYAAAPDNKKDRAVMESGY